MFDTFIVEPIFNLLIFIYSIIPGSDFGVSLILFTILIRIALYPLLKKQLHQVKLTKSIQPELERIKRESNGNKQIEGVKTMELYKKLGINPFLSIGILLIQLPIFIALFRVVRIFIDNRDQIGEYTYGFLQNMPVIKRVIENPDDFNQMLFGFIDMTKHAITNNPFVINWAIFVLVIISAITQYIMSKQTSPTTNKSKKVSEIMKEAAEGKEANQSEMNAAVSQTMIKYMPIMMFFIMLSFPAALALYYTTSNVVAVIQQHFLLKKGEEEIEKAVDNLPNGKKVGGGGKKATAKAREKQAREAKLVESSNKKSDGGVHITRINAKDDRKNKKRK